MAEQPVRLLPVAMHVPSKENVYAPDDRRPKKQLSQKEFMTKWADSARVILVSCEPDHVSRPERRTGYACGFDCWYIME